jgi:hypothetical protein
VRWVSVVLVTCLTAACSNNDAQTPQTATTVPQHTTALTSAGVPQGTTLRAWSGSFRLSETPGKTESVNGRNCTVYDGLDVNFGDSGDYIYADVPCVLFRNSRFRTNAAVSNTGALIQQAQENQLLIIEQSDFDGGPSHQRGVQADYSDLIVRNSRFTRFGNAGVEFDNSSANADLEVVDSYLEETSGWNPDDHVDGIQVGAGRNVTIRDNTVLVPSFGDDRKDTSYVSNSALGIWAELGDVTGSVTIQHNVLGGGGRVIYLQQKPPFSFDGAVSVTDNVIVTRYSAHGGIWGVLYNTGLPANLQWSANVFDNGGGAISLSAATADS